MSTQTKNDPIGQTLSEISANFVALRDCIPQIEQASRLLTEAVLNGHKVFFCGNGGSAAESQHLAAELMGRYRRERRALPSLSLTVDTSALTAIANDYSYDDVFARQLSGLGREGDVLVCLSTSGNSKNVVKAIQMAREKNIKVIGLMGKAGGAMKAICDVSICAPSERTDRIQEMHAAIGHILCNFVEEAI